LYRFEDAYHFETEGYHVGDKLNGNGSLRSFSKKITATNQMLDEEFNGYTNIVIYRTVGKAPYFDIGKYSNPYPYQQECLVPLDTMRVKDVNKYSGSGMRDEIYDKYGVDLGEYQYSLDNVTVVDVEYDPKVSRVVDSHGRTISSENLI
jgi:hypothetical protein